MTTPTGTITMQDIANEFGGTTPHSLNEYYAGGSYVPSGTSGVPTGGTISMDNLRGKSKVVAPTYALVIAPTSVLEGSVATLTVHTTNVPNGTTLYWSVSGTASYQDIEGATGTSGWFNTTNDATTFYWWAKLDSSVEGSESMTVSVRTGSVTGTVVASAALTFTQYKPTPTLTLSKSGCSSPGGSCSIYINVSNLSTYPAARSFTIGYTITGGAPYTGLATVTVPASASSSGATLIYGPVTSGSTNYSVKCNSVGTGFTDGVSNTITAYL